MKKPEYQPGRILETPIAKAKVDATRAAQGTTATPRPPTPRPPTPWPPTNPRIAAIVEDHRQPKEDAAPLPTEEKCVANLRLLP